MRLWPFDVGLPPVLGVGPGVVIEQEQMLNTELHQLVDATVLSSGDAQRLRVAHHMIGNDGFGGPIVHNDNGNVG